MIPQYTGYEVNDMDTKDMILSKYKDSMRPLIEKDMAETVKSLTA